MYYLQFSFQYLRYYCLRNYSVQCCIENFGYFPFFRQKFSNGIQFSAARLLRAEAQSAPTPLTQPTVRQ